MKQHRFLLRQALGLLVLASLVVAAPSARAGSIPDPAHSSCDFQINVDPCGQPICATVTLRDTFDGPVPNCAVSLDIVVESGLLWPGQILSVSATTALDGTAKLTLPYGIRGSATVHLEISAHCTGDILICPSPPFTVEMGWS